MMMIIAFLVGLALLLSLIEKETVIEIRELKDESLAETKIVNLDLEGFSMVQGGRVRVYFHPSQQILAQQVLNTLEHSLALINEKIGVATSLYVALFPKEEVERNFGGLENVSIRLKGETWPILVSQQWDSLDDGDNDFQLTICWTMPHEAVESSIAHLLYHDRRSRWVGDGLAEYSGYLVSKQCSFSVMKERLRDLIGRVELLLTFSDIAYNLINEFQVISGFGAALRQYNYVQRAGYSVSLAFWLRISQHYGEEVIQAFGERLSLHKTWCLIPGLLCMGPNAETAARILSELTGEDIWTKLQHMDLQEVRAILERAAQETPEG